MTGGKRFILASNNAKKLREMREILSGMCIEVISQSEAGLNIGVEETGNTFEENAYLKASAVTGAASEPAIADDSGLVVDALGGAPGVFSARYGGEACKTDTDRYELLLENMRGKNDRSAKFVSSVVCTFPDGSVIKSGGECPGEILHEPRGDGGFGYDPVFRPEGSELSMAEMSSEEKNAISHRGKALISFKKELVRFYADK